MINIELEKLKNRNNEKYKEALRNKATPSEKVVQDILDQLEIKYKFQKGFYSLKGKLKGYHCIVDFYIPSLKLCIEVDGKYHDQQKWKDDFRDKWLKKNRKVIVLRIKNEDSKDAIEIINTFIENVKDNKRSTRIKKNINFKYWREKYNLYKKHKSIDEYVDLFCL